MAIGLHCPGQRLVTFQRKFSISRREEKKHQTLDELKQRRNITNMTTTHDAHALPSEFSVDGVDGSGTKSSNVGFLWMIIRGTFSVAATPGVWGPLRWWRW